MTIDLAQVERRMQPGAWDTAGFLTPDASLEEVLAGDSQTLAARGLNAAALGAKLCRLLEEASAAHSDWGRPARLGLHDVEIVRQRGLITCPWAPEEFEACAVGGGSRPTANRFSVVDSESRRRLEGFELSAHFIRDHDFFGGPATRFRLEPLNVAEVLRESL